ncbi:MAG: hypothetical protein AAB380_01115 [Verrucomicrobiota bacterium]
MSAPLVVDNAKLSNGDNDKRRSSPSLRSSRQRFSDSHLTSGAMSGAGAVIVSYDGAATTGGGAGAGFSAGNNSQSGASASPVRGGRVTWRGVVVQPAKTASPHARIPTGLNTATLCGGTDAAQDDSGGKFQFPKSKRQYREASTPLVG